MAFFDVEAFELLCRAESDPEAAAQAMRLAARYIREQEPLPMDLREWLGDALDDAALKPIANRAKALTDALFLTVNNRRPAGSWLLIGREFEEQMTAAQSIASVAEGIAGKYEIDPTTAKRYWRRYQSVKARHDAID